MHLINDVFIHTIMILIHKFGHFFINIMDSVRAGGNVCLSVHLPD